MIAYTVGFLFTKDKREVMLVHKNRPGWQKGLYNGIGGHIDDGETPLECMIREFKEEADLDIKDWQEFCILTDNKEWRVHFFRSFDSDDKFNLYNSNTDEMIVPCLFRKDEYDGILLPDNVVPNLKWMIPMALSDDPGIPFKIEGYDNWSQK